MTEAVSLGELLHEEALLVLPGGSTPRTLIPVWTLPLRHISSSLSVARPFTNGVEWEWKKCTDPMVGGARSITLYDACTPSSELELGSFSVWKWSSQVQVALGKMADFGERKENWDWRHKKEKT